MKLPLFFFLSVFYLMAPVSSIAQLTNNLWTARLSGAYTSATPAIAPDGTIYQPTFNGTLLALTPKGQTNWKFKAGLEVESSPAIGSDGTIYFGSRDRKFYAVTPQGQLKWTFGTGAWNDSSPAIASDGTIYFGSWDKNFYALKPDGSLKWKFTAGGIIDSSPAIGADGTIYFGSHDKKFYALTPDGKVKWSFATGSQIISSPAINSDGTIYFTSTDGNLYAFKPDGIEIWHLLTGGAAPSSPVLDTQGTIYLGANQFAMAVSADGKKKWEQDLSDWIEGSPVVTDSQIYFASRARWVKAFTPDGTVSWTDVSIMEVTASPTLAKDGTLYFTCIGYFNAIVPTNAAPLAKSSWPLFRANTEHTGRVESH